MIISIEPTNVLQGNIQLPSSKSYSIRAAFIAACGGRSTISHFSDCDDAQIALKTVKALGAKVSLVGKNKFHVVGADYPVPLPKTINVEESGTTLRFILPLASLVGQKITVEGRGTLLGRSNLFLTETLRKMGADIQGQGKKESVPIRIQGGILRGGEITIDGGLSSQFISTLLIACPRLKENTHLRLTGKQLVSLDYISMTLKVLEQSGIKIKRKGLRDFYIQGNQKFQGLKNFAIPSDYGLAAFLMAAAILTRSKVTLEGIFKKDFLQADGQILTFLKRMGVHFESDSRMIKIQGPFSLEGGSFSLKDCPDLVPVMAVLALFAKTPTRLHGIEHARAKESDRISDLRTELLKVGAHIKEKNNELVIYPRPSYKKKCLLDPRHDHRLAMAFCVLGLKLGVRVKDIECVSKSYPQFIRDFKALGARVAT